MRTSSAGITFITRFEGFESRPYRDGGGVWTIGFGHTAGVSAGTRPITEREGRFLLARDLAPVEAYVNRSGLAHNQHEFDALVSAGYNMGVGYFDITHDLGRALRSHDPARIRAAFMEYVHDARGNVEPGLVTRRRAEANLYLSHPLNPVAHKLAVWRAELKHRRSQLKTEKNPGTRHFLIRRIVALVAAIRKYR